MDFESILAAKSMFQWYHGVLLLALIGIIIFYVIYRRRQQ